MASLLHISPLVKFVLLKSDLHLKPGKKKISLYQALETDDLLFNLCATTLISHTVTK